MVILGFCMFYIQSDAKSVRKEYVLQIYKQMSFKICDELNNETIMKNYTHFVYGHESMYKRVNAEL